jgi:hypothetical protein
MEIKNLSVPDVLWALVTILPQCTPLLWATPVMPPNQISATTRLHLLKMGKSRFLVINTLLWGAVHNLSTARIERTVR